MKTIGIVAHSAEGAALCFITACREGERALGGHMHPEIVLSAVPMGLSMPGWESGDHVAVAMHLRRGVEQVARAGADFFVCPDNTAHIVLEKMDLPLPGLHIAHVVCHEIARQGWKRVGLLGTKWTMNGPVYESALAEREMDRIVPDGDTQDKIQTAIFDELCKGVFSQATTELFLSEIESLQSRGAECVVLGCTEIPLVVSSEDSSLPVLDSTRLLAKYAVALALSSTAVVSGQGWMPVPDANALSASPSSR